MRGAAGRGRHLVNIEEVVRVIVQEYCNNMKKLLAAWQNNVAVLLKLSEAVPGRDPDTDASQRENLKALVEDLGRVQNMLKNECLHA